MHKKNSSEVMKSEVNFVHREMNLKNRIAHFMKAEGFHKKVCGSIFYMHFSMNNIIYIVNTYNSI